MGKLKAEPPTNLLWIFYEVPLKQISECFRLKPVFAEFVIFFRELTNILGKDWRIMEYPYDERGEADWPVIPSIQLNSFL